MIWTHVHHRNYGESKKRKSIHFRLEPDTMYPSQRFTLLPKIHFRIQERIAYKGRTAQIQPRRKTHLDTPVMTLYANVSSRKGKISGKRGPKRNTANKGYMSALYRRRRFGGTWIRVINTSKDTCFCQANFSYVRCFARLIFSYIRCFCQVVLVAIDAFQANFCHAFAKQFWLLFAG